jgi:hypothetical protein
MASYSIYDPRQAALNQLASLSNDRKRFTDMMFERSVAEQRAAEQAQYESAVEPGLNWMNTAGTGAAIGSTFGPWGAGAGALIGAGVGLYGATQARKAGGPGHKGRNTGNAFTDSLKHPFGNKWEGLSDVPVVPLAGMAGNLAAPSAPISTSTGASYGGMTPEEANLMFANERFMRDYGQGSSLSEAYGSGIGYTPSTNVQSMPMGGYRPRSYASAPLSRGYGPSR